MILFLRCWHWGPYMDPDQQGDMKNFLESLGLKVKLPMVVEMDNQGAVYLANSWSVKSRTSHIDV
jgi:hypothetical protein